MILNIFIAFLLLIDINFGASANPKTKGGIENITIPKANEYILDESVLSGSSSKKNAPEVACKTDLDCMGFIKRCGVEYALNKSFYRIAVEKISAIGCNEAQYSVATICKNKSCMVDKILTCKNRRGYQWKTNKVGYSYCDSIANPLKGATGEFIRN